jgi:hypothetical protein
MVVALIWDCNDMDVMRGTRLEDVCVHQRLPHHAIHMGAIALLVALFSELNWKYQPPRTVNNRK